MKTQIKGGPAFAYVEIALEPGESIMAESDAMSSMAAELGVTARFKGGFFKGVLRKLLGGESLFINEFKNNNHRTRRLTLVQAWPGDIRAVTLQGEKFYLQPGAFLACTPEVKLGLKWAGLVSFFAREGLFRLVVSGTGTIWYGAYGALLEREIDGELLVDTSHLVAYDPSLKLKLQFAGGIFASLLGGEALVTRVKGRGKVIIQSRSLTGLTGWINPKFGL